MNKWWLLFLFFGGIGQLSAQNFKHFIGFSDKPDSTQSYQNPDSFLSERSIERRAKEGVVLRYLDLPVFEPYVDSLKILGVSVGYSSRWFNGVYATIPDAISDQIDSLDFVISVDTINRFATASKRSKIEVVQPVASKMAFTESEGQLQMIGVNTMHDLGYKGANVLIAVFDGGFNKVDELEPFAHLYSDNLIEDVFDVVDNDYDVYHGSSHGTNVLSVLSGVIPEIFIGAAPEASYALYRTENIPFERRIEEYNWLIAAERADSLGVDIINSSLSYNEFDSPEESYAFSDMDGKSTVITRAATAASGAGILVVASAGNEGGNAWGKITAPADAEDIIAVAAVSSNGFKTSFSSIGFTFDGRIKPDLAAQGGNATVLDASGNTSVTNGTSFSSPLIAGLAAGVMELYPGRTSQEVKKMLIESASQVNAPDEELGYGIPNFNQIIANEASDLGPVILGGEVFPNPFSGGDLQIVNSVIDDEVVVVRFYNSMGQLMLETSFLRSTIVSSVHVNPVNWDSGIYFIELENEDKLEVVRFVKM